MSGVLEWCSDKIANNFAHLSFFLSFFMSPYAHSSSTLLHPLSSGVTWVHTWRHTLFVYGTQGDAFSLPALSLPRLLHAIRFTHHRSPSPSPVEFSRMPSVDLTSLGFIIPPTRSKSAFSRFSRAVLVVSQWCVLADLEMSLVSLSQCVDQHGLSVKDASS